MQRKVGQSLTLPVALLGHRQPSSCQGTYWLRFNSPSIRTPDLFVGLLSSPVRPLPRCRIQYSLLLNFMCPALQYVCNLFARLLYPRGRQQYLPVWYCLQTHTLYFQVLYLSHESVKENWPRTRASQMSFHLM